MTDHDQVMLRFVERFALMLVESAGLARMPARIFAYVLVDDAERYTAAELARGLKVSPGAVSGAVRHLVQLGFLAREHLPGDRSDTYRIYDDDVWGTITEQQMRVNEAYEQAAVAGVRVLGDDTPGGRRMRETQEFFAFMRAETPQLVERWRAHRKAVLTDG